MNRISNCLWLINPTGRVVDVRTTHTDWTGAPTKGYACIQEPMCDKRVYLWYTKPGATKGTCYLHFRGKRISLTGRRARDMASMIGMVTP